MPERDQRERIRNPEIPGSRYARPGMTGDGMLSACFLKRLLLVAAFLAGEFDAGGAFFRRDAVGRAAFAASRLDPGVALFYDNGLACHGFADKALGLLAHRLF